MSNPFDLLGEADGESGEAAVAILVGKKKAEADAFAAANPQPTKKGAKDGMVSFLFSQSSFNLGFI
jgi:hypothetical protein